jgi:hypothetical protein
MTKPAKSDPTAYEKHRQRAADRNARMSESGRDIGDIPPPADAARRESCRLNFRLFCETYGADSFPLAWSDDHIKAIAKIESAVLRGELFGIAMPRGSGKTTLMEWACLWALVYGHRQFLMLIGADLGKAVQMLDSIKSQIENNDLLLEDFPAVCYPVRALERIAQRAKGQTCNGIPTHIGWTSDEVTLPWIPGAASAGAAVRVAGITGNIRGCKHTRPDGKSIRPSLVLIDDPQTDESAKSPSQVADREVVMNGAILGLAGPREKMAGLCAITVIKPDDLADRILDRTRNPKWRGERTKLVYEWPTNEDLWSQYAELRREGQRNDEGTGKADEFYRQRQNEMDAGSRPAWPERKADDELSAIQHAWNLRIDRGEAAFMAEFQNQPIADDMVTDKLDKRALATRSTTVKRAIIPNGHSRLTAFIDVQDRLLFYLVCSWNESFGGQVVGYGTYPDQRVSFFDAATAKVTLSQVSKQSGQSAYIRFGLDELSRTLMSMEWKRQDGVPFKISQLLVDSNWGQSTQAVRNFCRETPYSSTIFPSRGKGITASSKPLGPRRNRGDRGGLNWVMGKTAEAFQIEAVYDTNYWKTFVSQRLRVGVGDPEAILFHEGNHELLIEHLTSEHPVRDESRGRTVDVWKELARDNHWFDCLVGAAVAASISGIQPAGGESATRQRRKVSIPAGPDGRRVIVTKRAK